jgi:hypothetical protein
MELVPSRPQQSLVTKSDSIHLGQEGQYHFDRQSVSTPNGFDIEISQISTGGTFLSARSSDLKKYTIESLAKADGGTTTWKPSNKLGKVAINQNWGNLVRLGNYSMEEVRTRLGNPGTRYGFIRVTDTVTGKQITYAVGAEFKGTPDNWDIQTAYFELSEPSDLDKGQSKPLLTPGS